MNSKTKKLELSNEVLRTLTHNTALSAAKRVADTIPVICPSTTGITTGLSERTGG